jgi:hypothetical protein
VEETAAKETRNNLIEIWFQGEPSAGHSIALRATEPLAHSARVGPNDKIIRQSAKRGTRRLSAPKGEPRLKILRRPSRPLLLRPQQTYRDALENRLHRNKRVGRSVMIDKTWDRRVEIDVSTRPDWLSPTGPAPAS